MVDCIKCVNRGKAYKLSQETYCDGCIHQGSTWRQDRYDPGLLDGKVLSEALRIAATGENARIMIMAADALDDMKKKLDAARDSYIEEHSDGETDCVTPYDEYGRIVLSEKDSMWFAEQVGNRSPSPNSKLIAAAKQHRGDVV